MLLLAGCMAEAHAVVSVVQVLAAVCAVLLGVAQAQTVAHVAQALAVQYGAEQVLVVQHDVAQALAVVLGVVQVLAVVHAVLACAAQEHAVVGAAEMESQLHCHSLQALMAEHQPRELLSMTEQFQPVLAGTSVQKLTLEELMASELTMDNTLP